MCAPSAVDLNTALRAFLQYRNNRPLTGDEHQEYVRLLTAWTSAERLERGWPEVIEAA
jgi:hypothetical protein